MAVVNAFGQSEDCEGYEKNNWVLPPWLEQRSAFIVESAESIIIIGLERFACLSVDSACLFSLHFSCRFP